MLGLVRDTFKGIFNDSYLKVYSSTQDESGYNHLHLKVELLGSQVLYITFKLVGDVLTYEVNYWDLSMGKMGNISKTNQIDDEDSLKQLSNNLRSLIIGGYSQSISWYDDLYKRGLLIGNRVVDLPLRIVVHQDEVALSIDFWEFNSLQDRFPMHKLKMSKNVFRYDTDEFETYIGSIKGTFLDLIGRYNELVAFEVYASDLLNELKLNTEQMGLDRGYIKVEKDPYWQDTVDDLVSKGCKGVRDIVYGDWGSLLAYTTEYYPKTAC